MSNSVDVPSRFSRRQLLAGAVAALSAAAVGSTTAVPDAGAVGTKGAKSKKSTFPLQAAAKAGTKPVPITLWHSMTSANLTALTALTNQFNASQRDVHVNLVNQNSYTDTLTAYTTALSGGQLPDVLQMETEEIQVLIDSQSIVPAGSAIAADHYSLADFLPATLHYFKVGGTQWAMPFNISANVLYYDQVAFEKAGLDPNSPPATLDAVRAAAQKIVSSGTAKYGISLKQTSSDFEEWMALGGHTLLNKDNGRSGRATAVTFDDALGQSIFTWWANMLDKHLAQATSATAYDNLLAIGSGIAPMTFDTSASLGTIVAVLSSGQYSKVKLGVGPLPRPTTKQVKTGGLYVGGAGLYMVNRSPAQRQSAAWQYIKFLVAPAQQAQWAAATGYLPVRRSSLGEPALTKAWNAIPGYRVPYQQLLASPSNPATAGAVSGAALQIDNAIQNALTSLDNGASPKRALAQAASTANRAIASYNERV